MNANIYAFSRAIHSIRSATALTTCCTNAWLRSGRFEEWNS